MLENDTIIQSIRLLDQGKQPNLSEAELAEFVQLLSAHHCYYLLSKLQSQFKLLLLEKVATARNKVRLEAMYSQCENVFRDVNESGIAYAVFKGTLLSEAAYLGSQFRRSSDIDILIQKKDLKDLTSILKNIGFIQGRLVDGVITPFTRNQIIYHNSMTHQTAPFIKENDSPLCPYLNVDINFDVMWGESGITSDMDYVLSHNQPSGIFNINTSKLSTEMDFVAVCLHHYKDMNSIFMLHLSRFSLSLLCDIFYFIKNNDDKIFLEVLVSICRNVKVTEYVYYCVYYAAAVFANDILDKYLSALYTPEGEALLNKFGLNDIEHREWTMDFYDRLFGNDFQGRFRNLLSEADIQKITANEAMMN